MNKFHERIILRSLGPLLSVSGIHRLFRPYFAGLGHILMFHRVVNNLSRRRIHNNQSLDLTPEVFLNVIEYFEKHKYRFISLNEAVDELKNGLSAGRFVVFTFDDGYEDIYTTVYPVLKERNIPFTLYITTDIPDRRMVLWWYLLEEYLVRNDVITVIAGNKSHTFRCKSGYGKERVFNKIRSLVMSGYENSLMKVMEDFFGKTYIEGLTDSLATSWDDLRLLAGDPLVTIGAHGITHAPLIHLSDTDAEKEILGSRQKIEEQLGIKVDHFSYPAGIYGEREERIVIAVGYKSAVTTVCSNLLRGYKAHLARLPRISINTLTTRHVLNLHVNGLIPFLVNGFKRIARPKGK